ncbi:P-loop containing nucleoside triphosphate hydrolase protein, partial [Aspergillus stella-maris]|uniref:P-loop containing nucleoside triphosphate hydrolase protein n=1 Tax=Aspergillus stella-maris TaxID=1810926 RepID=UPI003CCD5670
MMTACPATADVVFGPRVDVACRTFDFTVYFEDAFLACLPSAIFVALFPAALWQLRLQLRRVQRSRLLGCKLVVLNALLICQLVFVILRQLGSSTTGLQSEISIPSDVVELLALTCAIALSYIHHVRSIRPSTLLVCFLSARSLLSVARVRTQWLIPTATRPAIPFTLGFILTLVSTVLESLGKESDLVPQPATKNPNTPEPFSGFWKRATFAWLTATFREGYTKVISVHDLPDLDPKLGSQVVARQLYDAWSRANQSTRHGLLCACLKAYSYPLLAAVAPRLFMSGFTFCQPFLINATVTWVGNPEASMHSGKALIGAFALVYVGQAVFTSLYGYQTARYSIRIRGGLISLIHHQTVNTRAVDLGDTTAITLMGTDVERIVNGFKFIHELWASLIDIVIAIYLLERQVGAACLTPAVIVLLFVTATFKLSAATNKYQRLWIERIEERLRLTSYTLENIKAVKMLGLSERLYCIIKNLRYVEIATSTVFRKLLIVTIALSNSPADLAPMATFVVYIIIGLVRHDESLLAAQAFTSLSLVSLVTTPVLTFIQTLPSVVQCLGCFHRIQEYCKHWQSVDEDGKSTRSSMEKTSDGFGLGEISELRSVPKDLISFSNLAVAWKADASPVLRDMNLTIQHDLVTMVVGPIGSGKSTLLETILGETLIVQGSATHNSHSIAYCSQTPWLQSTDIRQNILGGRQSVDPAWYATVIRACGLESDLACLSRGDRTAVGSNGLSLSGGQKQRIALARALYSRCKVVLLDDVFSGIDAAATNAITQSLFSENGLFRRLQTTVVVATHSGSVLQYADQVIVMTDGRIDATGDLSSLHCNNDYIQSLKIAPASTSSIVSNTSSDTDAESAISTQLDEPADTVNLVEQGKSTDSSRQSGDLSVYGYYASVSGRTSATLSVIMTLLWCFCREFSTIWIDWWTEANEKSPNARTGMYLGVYVFFGLFGMVLMVIACWLVFVRIVSKSALRLHDDLLKSTMRAPFQFFHKVDIGSITNRFSQDMDLIDMTLPLEGLNTLAAACSCLVKVIILAVFARYLAIAIPFIAGLLYITQKFYLRTSRQMRLLDIEAKAPLYTHFLELVSGSATVRAFGWHSTFKDTCTSLLNFSQRPVYMLACIQHCLGFVLDLIVASMAVIVVATVVFLRDKFEAGDVGVALIMVMTFNTTLMQLIKYWTMTETSIGAVARVKNYVATTESEEKDDPSSSPDLPPSWPARGAIQLNAVVASHSPDSPPVLKDITLEITPGSKVAIVGSSGSGKTSLILSLLRMIPLSQGTMTIDSIDLSSHPAFAIRTRLNVVTQDPFLVPGSVRFNIDPFETAPDEQVTAALQRLGLWKLIEAEGGLDMEMNAASWSMGQRQLLCLARAMIRPGKVLILDEATSSVDPTTEQTMQSVLETEFSSHTVISVLHRLRYIHWYDRVAVLEGGALVEFDAAADLLGRDSRFEKLYAHSAAEGC